MSVHDLDVPAAIRERYETLFAPHRKDNGEFFNPWQSGGKPSFTDMFKWQLATNPHREAKKEEQPISADRRGLAQFRAASGAKVVWLGHATFLIEIDGFRCLVDPVYGVVGRFVKRFSEEPYPFDELPEIHAVFLTHGHYDHLDVETLTEVSHAHPDARFFAPLGQGRYVPDACGEVTELDWWQCVDVGGVEAVFVPMQHWHRRGPLDYNKGLWGGWVFRGTQSVLHAGDSGYFVGFQALGELFDIDLALLPVGAYEPRWFMKAQHMNPEDSIQAFEELRAQHFVAMHWGTYDLTDEPLNLGASEIRRLADDRGQSGRVHVPAPGGAVTT